MRWLLDLPIRHKLILLSLSTLSIALLLTAIFVGLYQRYSASEGLQEHATSLAQVIGNRSAASILFDDQDSAEKNLLALTDIPAVEAGCIFDAAQRLFASYQRASGQGLDCDRFAGKNGHEVESGALHVMYRIVADDDAVGSIYLRLSRGDLKKETLDIVSIQALIFIVIVILVYLAISQWRHIITDPIENVIQTAKSVSGLQDYSVRATKYSNDEIGTVAETFNAMLETIEQQNQALLRAQTGLETAVAERTKELTAANKELEAFSYSVSHDLRAPVRAILSFSQLVLEDSAEHLDKQSLSDLRRVVVAAKRMEQLIDGLLSLATISRRNLVREDIDLSEIALQICNEFQEQHPERDIRFSINPDLHCTCDGHLAHIILVNLLGNAVKYSKNTPQTVIAFATKEIDGERVYYVSDNGAGFDMQHADQLFTPFNRLHSDTEYKGSGIGLATVARIIQRHGGRIWAESEPDKGAVFYFTFNGVS